MTVSTPVSARQRTPSSAVNKSPLAMTGKETSAFNSLRYSQRAVPVKPCFAVRGCSVSQPAPSASSAGASTRHVSAAGERPGSSQPRRSLKPTRPRPAARIRASATDRALSMSLHIAAPDPVRATLGTEQPILQSNQTNPLSLSCPAAASMKGASLPNSWTTTGPSSGQVANSSAVPGLL